MILPFLLPLLGFLELALVFYPLVLVLIVLSILCLPADLNITSHRSRDGKGNPPLSLALSLIAYAVGLYHFDIPMGSWTHWLPLLGIYLVIGVVWSTVKWWIFCGKVRDDVKEKVSDFSRTVEDGDDQEEVDRSFMNYINTDSRLCKYKSFPYMHANSTPWKRAEVIDALVPLVSEHKGVVLTWLFCWPMSILKWALADMLRDLYNFVFNTIKGAFQKIAASRFKDI